MLCWVQSHTVSHCALTDVKCQCETDATITYVSNCVVDNCSLSDALGSLTSIMFGARSRLTDDQRFRISGRKHAIGLTTISILR